MSDERDRSTSDPGHVGPKIDPGWLDVIRQVVMFGLAVWLVVYSVLSPGYDIPFLVTALILFGIIPADRYLTSRASPEPDRNRRRSRRLD